MGFLTKKPRNLLIPYGWALIRLDGRVKVDKRIKSRLKEKAIYFQVFKRNIIEDDALREFEKILFI